MSHVYFNNLTSLKTKEGETAGRTVLSEKERERGKGKGKGEQCGTPMLRKRETRQRRTNLLSFFLMLFQKRIYVNSITCDKSNPTRLSRYRRGS